MDTPAEKRVGLKESGFAKLMERFTIFSYNKGHETQWNPARSGEAAPTRHPIAGKGQREFVAIAPWLGASKSSVSRWTDQPKEFSQLTQNLRPSNISPRKIDITFGYKQGNWSFMSIILPCMTPISGAAVFVPPQHIVLKGRGEILANRRLKSYFSRSHT